MPTMPSSRTTKPIIVNAQKHSHQPSNLAPASPPSPKTVRFAPRSAELASRPLTPQEAWSLYHFENHARGCRACDSRRLCDVGYSLSQDVRVLVCQHGGELCSTRPDEEGKWVRVEVPHEYDRVKVLLGAERSRERKRHTPIVSYDTPEPKPSRRREPVDVVFEPSRTHRDEERKSRQKTQHYDVVEVTPTSDHDRKYDKGEPVRPPERAKRGSLYESDMRRPRREYRLEERTPEKRERRDRSREREWKERDREERRERRRREREYQPDGGR
ncbi:hypothetical protein Q7P37_000564 [Cladosporium fusiforme]